MARIETMAEFWIEAERIDPEGFARARVEESEADDLRNDAWRYRKVRSGQTWSVIDGGGNALKGDELDCAIDAEIAG